MKKYDYLIVGCGLYGSVMAEQLFKKGKTVKIIEKRNHIGGNCYSYTDEETNINIHQYGTHIFHTNAVVVWNYINQFSDFNRYQHKVFTVFKNKIYPMPINLNTINLFYNVNLTPNEVDAFIESKNKKIASPSNFEEKAISLIGNELYEAFIKGYTIKQWNTDPDKLPASIIERLPVRKSYYDSYFNDNYQGLPLNGYSEIFKNMLKKIPIELNTDFFSDVEYWKKHGKKLVYTGAIDRYFNYQCGKLNWRSVRFEVEKKDVEDYQGNSVINFADLEIPYTRIHEPKHLHREKTYPGRTTIIQKEYSMIADDEEYYPVNVESDKLRLSQYNKLALKEKNTIFGGRLAEYKYFDMDKVITSALLRSRELN